MTKKFAVIVAVVLTFSLSALADGGAASNVVNLITALPEPGTLGLLGSGLVGFAILVRHRMKIA